MKKLLLILLMLPIIIFGQSKIRNTSITSGNQPAGKIMKSDGATGVIWGEDETRWSKEEITEEDTARWNLSSILSQTINTGFLDGLNLTINADPTKYNLSAGYYVITDYSDPIRPAPSIRHYTGGTGLTPYYLTTSPVTYIALDLNGNIVSSASPFTDSQRRLYCIIGALIHSNLSTINVTNELKAPIRGDVNQLHDLIKAIGSLNLSGNVYSESGANLNINKTAGEIFALGINADDYTDPHQLTIAQQTALTFRYRLQTGTEYANTTNINTTQYDLDGVLTTVSNNKFTIQRINLFQSGITRIQYGQNEYANMEDALLNVNTEPFTTEQNIAENAIFRCYLILKKGVTNLTTGVAANTVKFIPVDKFGNVLGGAGAVLTYESIVAALGFIPENVANKVTSISVSSTDLMYPSAKAMYDKFLRYRLLTNHDSLSKLDEKSYNSLTDKPDLSALVNVVHYDDVTKTFTGTGTTTIPGVIKAGADITISNKNKHYEIIQDRLGTALLRSGYNYWNGSSYSGDHSLGLGRNAILNNSGGYSTGVGDYALTNNTGAYSTGIGPNSLENNSGLYSSGIGSYSLQNNSGNYSNGFGYYSLQNNSGSNSSGFGAFSLQNNKGNGSSGIGQNSLQNNIGSSSNGFGVSSLENNLAEYSSGIGYNSLQYNTGYGSDGIGFSSLEKNTGIYATGIGSFSNRYNIGSYNSAIGYQSASIFNIDESRSKSFSYTDINITTDRITLTAHGFSHIGGWINVKYAQGTSLVGNIYDGEIYQIYIVDANTISFRELQTGTIYHGTDLTSTGTGTGHTLTPQFEYSNSSAIGANSKINANNSINLGNASVTTVYLGDSLLFTNPIRSGSSGESGQVLTSQGVSTSPIWTSVSASQVYKGTWNASTNTPTIANGVGTAGWYYRVTVAGTWNSITFAVGDDVSYNGSVWQSIPVGNYEVPLTFSTGLNRTGNTITNTSPNATHTGDVIGSTALTIDVNKVTNAKAAQMATKTYKGRTSAGTGNAEDVPVATLKTDLNLSGTNTGDQNLSGYKLISDSTAIAGYTRRDRLASELAKKKNTFTENTGFNKNFGSALGTVTQGNDSRLSDSRVASDVYAWAKASVKPSYNKSEVGLSLVDNTSDAAKPVSTAQQTALNLKVDIVSGKGLSTNDYTTTEKTKLSGIAENANNYSHPATHAPSIIAQDASYRFVTDTQIGTWNGKLSVTGGTLTGALNGTTANFNNYISSNYSQSIADMSAFGAGNYGQIKISSSNNALNIGVDNVTNSRNGWIQVGHENNAYPVSSIQGRLQLNPYGGGVYINGGMAYHSGNSNRSTVDWNAKQLTAQGLQVNGRIRSDLGAVGTSLILTGTGSNFQVNHDGGLDVKLLNTSGGGFDFNSKVTSIGLQVNGSANVTGNITAPTIKLTTGATDGYVLKSDATGNGTWTPLAASQVFKGTWEAHTNTPTLVNGIGTAGWYYRVTTAGTVNFGSGNITFFMGDDVSYNGTVWQRIPAATIAGNPLTRTNDTNVTLTLTGSPNTALLNATGITAGWTGTLADARVASAANWNTAYTLSHTFRTESFQEFATGTTGQNNVLTYAPKTQTGVTCEMNGQQLIYGTQFSVTLATKIVKVLIPVYKYDQLRITYTH